MILLFGSNYGKDTSELDSGYLLWIIEKYQDADWSLINACKQEISSRFKLDWLPKSDHQHDLETALKISNNKVIELLGRTEQLTDLLAIAILSKGNHYLVNLCESNPRMIPQIIEATKLINQA